MKVGDTVRIIAPNHYLHGKVGVVSKFDNEEALIKSGNWAGLMTEDEVTIIHSSLPDVKAGDTVRVNTEPNNIHNVFEHTRQQYAGKEMIVLIVDNNDDTVKVSTGTIPEKSGYTN